MGPLWIEGFEAIKGVDDRQRPGGIGRAERERIFWERVASGQRAAEIRDHSAESGAWESLEMAIVTLLAVVIFGLGWVSVELEGTETAVGYDLASLEPIGLPNQSTETSVTSPTSLTSPTLPTSPIWPEADGSQRTESTESIRKGPR